MEELIEERKEMDAVEEIADDKSVAKLYVEDTWYTLTQKKSVE